MSTELDEILAEEIRDLLSRGFQAAWMGDLQVGDIFASPRLFHFDPPRSIFVVERLLAEDGSYVNEDDDFIANRVINMIVTDEEGLTRHLSYGHSHGIYIWRP